MHLGNAEHAAWKSEACVGTKPLFAYTARPAMAPLGATHHTSRCGGIGRRARLKIWLPQGSVGSIPSTGTRAFFALLREHPQKLY